MTAGRIMDDGRWTDDSNNCTSGS